MGYATAMTSFTRMVDATPEDYGVIARHALGFQQGLPDRVVHHLALLAGDTGGYAVDRLTHSVLAAVIVQPFVSEENHWIVKQHGIFQGYYFFHHMGARSEHARPLPRPS